MKPSLRAIEEYCKAASPEDRPSPYRSEFMRDRDRILYSRPFRRLSKKTQVFLETAEDHIRTRLTHTLEVAQIATTSAKFLTLDRDLTEAIAVGHDLGHTPFGHSGEKTLNLFLCNCDKLGDLAQDLDDDTKGFKHNLQSVRILSELTGLYDGLDGLNLTNFTLWGIQSHTGTIFKKCAYASKNSGKELHCNYSPSVKGKKCDFVGKELSFYKKYSNLLLQEESVLPAWSFEAYLVKWADEIAQRHHDIEDGIIAEVIDRKELYQFLEVTLKPFFNRKEKRFFKNLDITKTEYLIQELARIIVGCLNRNLIENSFRNLKRFKEFFDIKRREDFLDVYPKLELDQEISDAEGTIRICDIVSFAPELKNADERIHGYLKDRILNSYAVQRMDGKARFILRQIAKAYLTNPQQLTDSCIQRLFKEVMGPISTNIGDMRNWLNDKYFSQEKEIKQSLLRIICDLIAGMTDQFAMIEHQRLYSSSENLDLRG